MSTHYYNSVMHQRRKFRWILNYIDSTQTQTLTHLILTGASCVTFTMGTDASAPPILLCLRSKNIKQSYHEHCYSGNTRLSLNPLSPDIHLQILFTDLYTFPLRISWANLTKDQGIFVLVIILLILITFSFDSEWVLLTENWCWSPLQWQIQGRGPGDPGK